MRIEPRVCGLLLATALGAVPACVWPGLPPAPGRPFRVIAHRGASGYAPENTLPAFRRALELGAFEVELDVQLSGDDVVFLFHDRRLDSKTNGQGTVRSHTSVELREMEIGGWFDREHGEVPQRYAGTGLATLREVFAEFGDRLLYHIELKALDEALPRRVLDLVREFRLSHRVVLTSFYWEQLARARALAGRVPICFLVEDADDLFAANPAEAGPVARDEATLLQLQGAWIDRAAGAGFDQVAVRARDLSPEIVARAHAHGLEIRAWGVRSREDMLRARQLGTNGMTINWPDRLLEMLAEERS